MRDGEGDTETNKIGKEIEVSLEVLEGTRPCLHLEL